mmetsp:Transcript_49257/g.105202  ORF Transcript_49257/g.105202 Transcript_49257/m.105202 type:complete len:288 (-) Transcript_49257:304-1167(-)
MMRGAPRPRLQLAPVSGPREVLPTEKASGPSSACRSRATSSSQKRTSLPPRAAKSKGAPKSAGPMLIGASRCAGTTRSNSQLCTLATQAKSEPSATPRLRMIWMMGSNVGAPSLEYLAKLASSEARQVKGCQPPQPSSNLGSSARRGASPMSACVAPGMKKLKSSTIRLHPLRLASGESATTSRGLSRAWKSSARVYSGSAVRIGGGSSVTPRRESQMRSVFDGLCTNATSWKYEPGPGLTVSTSCSSSSPHMPSPAEDRGSGRVQAGNPRKALGSGSGKEYCWSTA